MKREELVAYRAKLMKMIEAVDVLLDSMEATALGVSQPLSAPVARVATPSRNGYQISLSHAVEEAVNAQQNDFTTKEILSYVHAKFAHLSKTTIKNVGGPITRMYERKKIDKVRDGAGNLPTIYRRIAMMPSV